jgi:hypothetical protein
VIRESDRTLYDVTERRRISLAELRDFVGDGGYFEARRHDSGADCTAQVLQDLLSDSLATAVVPGLSSAGMPMPLELFLRMTELRAGHSDRRWDLPERDDRRRRSSDDGRSRDWEAGPRPPSRSADSPDWPAGEERAASERS